MVDKESNYEKYDHAEAIRQQIKHVNHLMTGIDTEDEQKFKRYFSKAFMGIASLENMVAPFGYESELEDKEPHRMNKSKNLSMLRDAHAAVMQFLYEEDLFYAQRTGRRKT